MQIPEELLKLSEKELKEELSKSVHQAKYFIDINNTYIIIKEYVFKNYIFYKTLTSTNICMASYFNFHDSFIPLNYKDIKIYLKELLFNKIHKFNNEKFAHYLEATVCKLYSKDSYELNIYDSRTITLTLYFPETTITNSIELSHTMYDIYFKFTFRYTNSKWLVENINMTRTTVSIAEYLNNYLFSHARSNKIGQWSSLCFGNTELQKSINKIYKGGLSDFSSILISIPSYLSWESIEGSPYMFISNLLKTNNLSQCILSTDENNKLLNNMYYNYIINTINNFKYTFEIVKDCYTIKLSQSSIDLIDSILTNKYPENCYIQKNNISYTPIVDNNFINDDPKLCLEFNGKDIYSKIINNMKEDNYPKQIHRIILREVVDKIESNFEEYLINKKLNITI